MIVYITNTDDVFFYFSSSSFSFGCFILYRLFVLFLLLLLRFAIVPICQLLLFTEWFWFILFPRYFTFRFPIGYFSGFLPLIFFSLFSFLFQCLLGWILFVLSMYIRIFAYFFRVFTFLHVYRLMFRVHYSFFCSFNGGKVLFLSWFSGFL